MQDKAGTKHKILFLSELKLLTADPKQTAPAGQGPGIQQSA